MDRTFASKHAAQHTYVQDYVYQEFIKQCIEPCAHHVYLHAYIKHMISACMLCDYTCKNIHRYMYQLIVLHVSACMSYFLHGIFMWAASRRVAFINIASKMYQRSSAHLTCISEFVYMSNACCVAFLYEALDRTAYAHCEVYNSSWVDKVCVPELFSIAGDRRVYAHCEVCVKFLHGLCILT